MSNIKMSDEDTIKAEELRERGWTYREIGRYFSVGRNTIHEYLNPESRKKDYEQVKKWKERNREHYLKQKRRYNTYRRGLGFIPLNEWFPGSVAHHINQDTVVYIPKRVHSFFHPHGVHTGENMWAINQIALMVLEKPGVI